MIKLNDPKPLLDFKQQDYTILIVDDNLINLDVMFNCLEGYGFDTLVAEDGEGALLQAKFAQPDIILLDVTMPGIDGFETCRRLKADEKTRDIPVIFMTALDSTAHKVKGFEVGAVDYVTKPIQQDEVLARVTNHLRLKDLTQNLLTELKEREHIEAQLRSYQSEIEQSYHREQDRRRLSETLREVAIIVSSTLDQDEVLELILGQLDKVIVYDRASVTMLFEDQLTLVGVKDKWGMYTDTFTIPVDRYPLNAETLKKNGPVLIADVQNDARWQESTTTSNTRSFINAPLIAGGEPIGLLGVARNDEISYTTDDAETVFAFATQVAMALRNAQFAEQNRQALNDKDKFFSIVAHDLRGPFMPFIETTRIMAEMSDSLQPQDIQELASSLHNSAKNVYQLLENLLEWARIQMGRMPYRPQRFTLNELVARNIDLLIESATNKGITLHNHLSASVELYADEFMVNTVLRNLISNALKFTPTGGSVTISVADDGATAQFVTVAVTDTGVGIQPEDIDKLFKIGERYSTMGTAEEKGTGLGLILCREMIER